jgi:hypothetical protein
VIDPGVFFFLFSFFFSILWFQKFGFFFPFFWAIIQKFIFLIPKISTYLFINTIWKFTPKEKHWYRPFFKKLQCTTDWGFFNFWGLQFSLLKTMRLRL